MVIKQGWQVDVNLERPTKDGKRVVKLRHKPPERYRRAKRILGDKGN
jgi:hypothetical protein